MQKLRDYWAERSRKQRLTLAGVFVGSLLAIAAFAWAAGRTPLALLYSSLDPAQAGEVVAEVDRRGIPYEVRGETIWVASADRDRLRMDLAAQGLPAAGGSGYELLDGMSGFGTTSQMFDAAYWRAKEGELARTILALPNVKSARVHLAVPTTRGYRRESAGTASVTITTTNTPLSREQARSLQFLISSGVPGMAPEAVSVIDSAKGVINPADDQSGADREADIRRNVERILEAHVGGGNAIVELHLDLDGEREQLTEQRFDPKERALVSEEVEETKDQSSNGASGAVTASSNLPDSEASKSGEQSRANRAENRQRSNYEVSQVTREVLRQPGAVKRLTVAVLVNGVLTEGADGKQQLVPRSEAELGAIRELVASAVGFDEARGDQLTVKSLPFAAVSDGGTLAERPGWLDRLALNDLARLGLIGLFALGIALVLLRPALKARMAAALTGPAGLTMLSGTPQPAGAGTEAPGFELLPAPAFALPMDPGAPVGIESGALPMNFSMPEFSFEPMAGGSGPVERLRELMRTRQDESVKLLSAWIGEGEAAS
ncbi:flagellar M-ring protein FliF [Paracoccus suum]|uniref:Flagellar M-ring protein n=1 Tax=Paracoccus suum TaxID=2259340 RepID=A0A344PI31_9RHOB|nr:flagellar basal-body MS-ring/collar protein FliF [Paracoccus suum]AXC49036.1 flagellar M-ring protein FliF [Paracoccus suum]